MGGLVVSILVLLDMVLKDNLLKHFGIEGESFNPCFAGYGSKRTGNNLLSRAQGCVSILVLLDMVLKAVAVIPTPCISPGFNPCFAGYGSKSIHFISLSTQKRCFNPCFAGYGSKRIVTPSGPKIVTVRFNPCFAGYGSKRSIPIYRTCK